MVKFDAGDGTYGAVYGPAMQVQTVEEAQEYLADLAAYHSNKWGKPLDEAQQEVLSNLGYYSGYYNAETFNRVMELFGAAHPVFGTQWPIIK